MPSEIGKQELGMAGEYYVAAELARRGWIVTLTLKNSPIADILAFREDKGLRLVQVKTCRGGALTWLMNEKHENANEALIFVLVNLYADESPIYYLFNSEEVAQRISTRHKGIIAKSGHAGESRRGSTIRKFILTPAEAKKVNNWDDFF